MNVEAVNALRGAGIPGARNIDHVAFTVPDLDAACRFFVAHLGATLLYVEGPIRRGRWMTDNLNVHSEAECTVALLRLGPTCNLELFTYDSPDHNPVGPRNSDVGGHHLAVHVDDVDVAHAYLTKVPGVTCQGTPKTIANGPISGSRWLYFTTPWGLQMELTSTPGRLPYETTVPARRYGPHPGEWADA
ncbi:VOC family protein [Streptomyces sp. NPDC020472]|uniref:VOC family protein n=1 Tax=Streptomyces sp. NPDC020472 TaxID=3365075 RepID=UPI0037B3A341